MLGKKMYLNFAVAIKLFVSATSKPMPGAKPIAVLDCLAEVKAEEHSEKVKKA